MVRSGIVNKVSVTPLIGAPFVSLTCPEIVNVGIGGLELGAHEGARAPFGLLVTLTLSVPSVFEMKTFALKLLLDPVEQKRTSTRQVTMPAMH